MYRYRWACDNKLCNIIHLHGGSVGGAIVAA